MNKPFEQLHSDFACQPSQHFTVQSIKEDDKMPSVSTPFQH